MKRISMITFYTCGRIDWLNDKEYNKKMSWLLFVELVDAFEFHVDLPLDAKLPENLTIPIPLVVLG